jgi:hypothetical protein
MPLTFPQSLRDALRARLTRRGVAVVLALAIELGLLLLFLGISSGFKFKDREHKPPKVFRVEQPKKKEKKAAPPIEIAKEDSKRRNGGGSNSAAAASAIVPPVAPVNPDTGKPANILWLTRNDYRASDIAGRKGTATGLGQGNGTSAESDSALADGKGPHGEKVYRGDWYRLPTNAEIVAYWPARSRGREGWGEIMCRTAPHYRVEDCVEIDDSPRGSGFANAALQAAWQFKFRPPRVGGQAIIGAWIRFRVTYNIVHVKQDEPPPQPDDQ